MTILIDDCRRAHPDITESVEELLYADDTLILGNDSKIIERYIQTIATQGKKYGLSLNMDKLEMIRMNTKLDIMDPMQNAIPCKQSMRYLGALLSDTGNIRSELGQRIGLARQEFHELARIWKHANISRHRKIELYTSCVVSKLLYALHSTWLSKQQRCKLNAFHCKCLRAILNIPHSYISRIRNEEVLRQASSMQLSNTLLKNQLTYFGKLARTPSHLNRDLVFKSGSCKIAR